MQFSLFKKICTLSGLTSSLLLSACTVVTPAPVYHRGAAQYPAPSSYPAPNEVVVQDVVTEVAPPAPMQEIITVAPAPGYFWINGFWYWEGGRHVWRAGYWAPPRVGFSWVPHHWERVGVSWHFRAGHWGRRH